MLIFTATACRSICMSQCQLRFGFFLRLGLIHLKLHCLFFGRRLPVEAIIWYYDQNLNAWHWQNISDTDSLYKDFDI